MADSRLFLDANILVYSSFPTLPLYEITRSRLGEFEDAGNSFWICRQILREFLAATTRPGNVLPSPGVTDLTEMVREWEARCHVAEDDAYITEYLLEFIGTPGAKGKQVHDANIVATMRRHRIPYLLTHNTADFARYSPWITVLPLIP